MSINTPTIKWLLVVLHLAVAQEGYEVAVLCCEIFINEQEAEVNIVLFKSTVDTNLDGIIHQGEHRCPTTAFWALKYVEWEEPNGLWRQRMAMWGGNSLGAQITEKMIGRSKHQWLP